MKDGRTHLAHKVEHSTDLDTTAIVAVTVQSARSGDTTTVYETLAETSDQLREALPSTTGVKEVVLDKGYHSNDVLADLSELGVRTYVSEPARGRRRWKDKAREQTAVYANRRRIRGGRGQRLRKLRGEIVERSMAHCYVTGGLRRVHVRRRDNVAKRVLLQAATYNLALMMRALIGVGTPKRLLRGAAALAGAVERGLDALWLALQAVVIGLARHSAAQSAARPA